MKKTVILFCAPLLLFSKTINFETALDLALQNNKELKAKKLEVEKTKASLKEAKSYDLGKLIFNENISRTNNAGYVFGAKLASREATFGDFGFSDFLTPLGIAINNAANDIPPSDMSALLKTQPNDLNYPEARTNYETKLSYDVPIFTGYKLQNAKEMAKLQVMANEVKYKFDEKALGLEVLKAYNGAVAAKHFITAVKKAKNATNSFVTYATELYKEGLVTQIDVKQAKVYDMGVNAKIIEAQNHFQLALAYLRFLTDDKEIDDVESFINIQTSTKVLETIQNEALQKRDDYAWMGYNVKTMQKKIHFDSAEIYPMIGAHIEYGTNDDTFTVSSDKDYYVLAVGLQYTLFDAQRTSLAKQKAKIDYQKTKHYYEYMKDGIKLEIEKNYLTLKAKKEVLKEKQKAQNLAEEVLEQSEQMYKNHLINMTNLLMQQANAQKAEAEAILAKFDESIAAAQLKLSLGKSLKD